MTEVWGQLNKALDDDQTINEAIDEAVASHEADAAAHLGATESLQSHAAAAIIDHVVGSVVADKMSFTEYVWHTTFDSIDRWTLVGSEYGTCWPGITLWCDGVAPVLSSLKTYPIDRGFTLDGNKNSYFQATVRIDETSNKICLWGFGTESAGTPDAGYGFKVSNTTLYGYMDTSEGLQTVELTGVNLAISHVYRAQYNKVNGEVVFYVDGVDKGSIVDAADQLDFDMSILLYVKSTVSAEAYLNVFNLVISTE